MAVTLYARDFDVNPWPPTDAEIRVTYTEPTEIPAAPDR
jgi:hypothetical protein